MGSRASTLLTGVIALLLAGGGGVLTSTPAAAATCTGVTTSWTGLGDGHGWSDPANWDQGVPTDTGSAVVGSAALTVDGITGTVCDLTVSGPLAAPGPALSGQLTVAGDAALGGATSWAGTLMSTQSLTVPAGADLALGDGTVVTVAGPGTLGAGALVHGPASTPSVAPALAVPGTLSLGGAATMDGVSLQVLPQAAGAGSVQLAGSTLTLRGAAVSSMREGTTLSSSTANGALVVGSGARLVVTTGASVQQPASLRLTAGSTLGQDGGSSIISGTGTLNWQAGTLAGDVTFGLPALLDGGGTRVVPMGSTLTNTGQLTVADGRIDLLGTLVNTARVQLRPGVTVAGAPGGPSTLSNPLGATLAVEPVSAGGTAVLDGVHLTNAGAISVPSKERLVLGSSGAVTVSDLLDGGTLSSPSAPVTTSDPQGMLQVAQGSTLRVSGQTTLAMATLLLDDPSGDGSAARLVAGSVIATLKSAELGGGGFSWRSGTIAGALTIDKLTTDITSTSGASKRVLEGLDDAHPGVLRLGGTATLNPTLVSLAAKAKLVVTGTLTLASSPGGVEALGALDGQQVVIATGGTLRHVAQSTTPNGSSNSTAAMTIAVPVLNNGTVTLETSLNVAAGYIQDVAVGAPTSATPPVTGLFGSAVLSGSNGSTAVAPITLVRGGLGGTGTVEANPLSTGTGFLHPGTAGATGTLTVKGNVVLGSGTDLQIVLKSATDHDKLVVLPLTVGSLTLPGNIALGGTISGLSQGYNPVYGTTVTEAVKSVSRTGTFTTGASSGLSNGFGWRPLYPDATTVSLRVTDTSPPAIGIAGNSPFTQFTSQRFTYSAVDNKSGVDSFDVRWQQATPTSPYGAWTYPATWQSTRNTSQTLTGLVPGHTYCFSVRARDFAHNVTGWSQPLCTARMLDDRNLTASSGWTRPGGLSGWYNGTYSRTVSAGATLKRGGTFTRVAFTAQKCPGCGNVVIYSGTTRIGSLSLSSATSAVTSWVSPVLTSRNAVVTLRVSGGGHPVTIDAFGLAR